MYCAETECEKRNKGYCKTPTKPVREEDAPYDMTHRCTCKECKWDMVTPSLPACDLVGDGYNIDGDCIALK